MSALLYATLTLTGKFSADDLQNFRQWGSCTSGHPELDVERGIENTSGPLGQGHVYAVGAAIAAKFIAAKFGEGKPAYRIYTLISDGGVQEEISQGAGRIAGHLGLDNLTMFYDANNIQLSTSVNEVTSEDVAGKYEAWGWRVEIIDGNDAKQIRSALRSARMEDRRPTLIIGHTIMGKGCLTADNRSAEGLCSTHGQPLSAAGVSLENTVRALGGDPANPFAVFPEVQELYRRRSEELQRLVAERRERAAQLAKAEPERAKAYARLFTGDTPAIDWNAVVQKPGQSTRAASATVLSVLAEQVGNMIVASADLSNSDKTDGFLKKTKAITRKDFTGAFLQAGVSELTMACLCMGMALHGGVIAACGTFFVFSDYMKPAVRMAALMRLPVKFIWTHDAFRVGEDGPTHEPVEQEAQIRLMEKLKNHRGENSMLVLRPADVHETTAAWRLAMENTGTPTGLILSRQSIKDLPGDGTADSDTSRIERGGYVVCDDGNPDVTLVASGSEVATLIEGACLLKRDGIRTRVVSVPSEGLFATQSAEYRNSVIPENGKVFGLTAGLPVTLQGLVGSRGKVWGLESFGYSAPAEVLDEKFGFTGANVRLQVLALLERTDA
jgi:transketolase